MLNQINVSNKRKVWKEWFNSRKSAETINKKGQEKLFKNFENTKSVDQCKIDLENYDETTFLFRQNFGTNTVGIFHHMKSVGKTIYTEEDEEFGFIQGVEESATYFMTPDFGVLTGLPQDDAVQIPTANQFFAVTSVPEVDTMTVGLTTSYKPRNFIPIPPFLLNTISTSISKFKGNSKQVIVDVVQAIKEFDNLHANDNDYKEKAKTNCKDILSWLFLVNIDKIQVIPTMGCVNRELIDHFSEIETDLLSSPNDNNAQTNNEDIGKAVGEALKPSLELLATSASTTQEFMQKLTQIQASSSDKASKSFKKIAPKYQKLLLIASSVQQEGTPVELNDQAMEFFNQSSVLNAQIFLNSHLDSLQIECTISSALTSLLMHGAFLWTNSLTPSGLASSVITSNDILRNDLLQEGIVLDYSTKHEMSNQSLAKLTKTQVLFPTTIEASIERFEAIHALVELFFGQNSFPQQGIRKFINNCIDNKNVLRTKYFLDDMFISKLHFMFDDRLNKWLEQCGRAEDVMETDLNLIQFSTIFSDIHLNRFYCDLPDNISKIVKRKSEDEVSNEEKKKKLKKHAQSNAVELINNNKQEADWKVRINERFDTVFKGKTKEGPMLSIGCKPCLKFHGKGYCFSDCIYIKSHKQLTGDDKTKTSKFFKQLRGE